MDTTLILTIIALAAGFYMAWSVGANDVANAMGTSVGSGALTVKRAVILAAVLEFAGAFFVGSHVSQTIRKGIISPGIFVGHELDLVFGMIGALLAAAIWLQVASYYGWPVSTTHSIVGAVLGFGIVFAGVNAIHWAEVGSIVASWVVSPLLSGTIAFVLFSLIRRLIYYNPDPVAVTKRLAPYLVFLVFMVLSLAMVFKGLKNLHLDLNFSNALGVSVIVGLIAALISYFLIRRIKEAEPAESEAMVVSPSVARRIEKALQHLEKASSKLSGESSRRLEMLSHDLEEVAVEIKSDVMVERNDDTSKTVEKIFVYLQILSAGFVAFAHGANDVANAVGPLAAVITILQDGVIAMNTPVPVWVLALGGIGIVMGLATWGWRVMLTIGKKITELTPTRGFAAEFATAITLVIATKLGLPVSTTHTLVGGVLGVGFARGIKSLNLKVITNIIISWLITIPVGAAGAIMFYYILRTIF